MELGEVSDLGRLLRLADDLSARNGKDDVLNETRGLLDRLNNLLELVDLLVARIDELSDGQRVPVEDVKARL